MESQTNNAITPLMKAAKQGIVDDAKRLLKQGENPNKRNSLGQTALHLAVKGRHVNLAALFLAYGADHTLPDRNGCLPLGQDYTNLETLHRIRQQYHRLQICSHNRSMPPRALDAEYTELENSGITKITGLVSPSILSQLRADFEEFIHHLQRKILKRQASFQHYDQEDYWWVKGRAFITNNAFKYSTELINLVCNQDLLELINRYFGKEAFIQRGVAMRYLPSETMDNEMFGWHHDMEDKRLKLIILLTDVSETGQYMSYVLRSHKLFHPYEMFYKNTCNLEYCREHLGELEIFNTIGKAGDIFVFDSNGSHRGNRQPNAQIRDAFFIEFTTDKSDIWGGDIAKDILNTIPLVSANPFSQIIAAEKKWKNQLTRRFSTWIENLPYPERWLLPNGSAWPYE
jgi:hypothetical protein